MSDFSAWIEKNKALWTRVYDEVIAPDLEEEWKKREDAHKKELRQREENQQLLLNHLKNKVVKNSHLTSDNEQFRKQLEFLINSDSLGLDAEAHYVPDVKAGPTSVSAEEHDNLVDNYNALNKKYRDLSQKIKYLERKNNAVMQKNKDMKESVRAWQDYADRQSGKQKQKHKFETEVNEDRPKLSIVPQVEDTRPHMLSSPRSMAATCTPPPHTEPGNSSPVPATSGTASDVEDGAMSATSAVHQVQQLIESKSLSGSVTPHPSVPSPSSEEPQKWNYGLPTAALSPKRKTEKNAMIRVQSELQTAHLNSSQTTVDEEDAEQTIGRTLFTKSTSDDEEDFPQVVSTRCLKRKRDSPSNTEIFADHSSDGTPEKPFRIKEEPASSPPNIHSLVRKETIDLDDPISDLLKTPRHARQILTHSNLNGALCHQISSNAPFIQPIKKENTHYGLSFETPNMSVHLDPVEAVNSETRAFSEPSNGTQKINNVLGNLDPNIVTDSSIERINKRMKRNETRLESLAASGKESFPADPNAARLAPSAARAKLNRRLNDSNSPRPQLTSVYPTTPATTKIKLEQNPTSPPRSQSVQTPQIKVREPQPEARYITPDGRPQWSMKIPGPRSSTRNTVATPPNERDRLRSKPVSELKLQDFRPNPTYNQGYSYAFSETIRKRGDRMCLPGCTNAQCCGSTFRTFAEAQGPLSHSDEESLLEDYLGEAYDNMSMTQMSSSERQELILQARTRKMAKEAGKHREAYERRRTPPGFWRVDFPTTQELEEDREKAKEQERALVRERWVDAQQKGGRWIFRDE